MACKFQGFFQVLISNDKNRVRKAILGLSQNGACTNLFENFCDNCLKRDLSDDTTFSPPLFSLVNTLKFQFYIHFDLRCKTEQHLGNSKLESCNLQSKIMYKRRLAVSFVQISLLLFEIEFLYIIGERVKLQFSKF